MSDDTPTDDVIDAEIVDDGPADPGEGPGTDLAVTDPRTGLAVPEPDALERGPQWVYATARDLDPQEETDHTGSLELGMATGGASRSGGSRVDNSNVVDRPGGNGIGGGKAKRRRERGGSGSGSGSGFTLFGFTVNLHLLNNLGSGNALVRTGGKAARDAKAARLTRGGKLGSQRAMRGKIRRAGWLDRALGGGR